MKDIKDIFAENLNYLMDKKRENLTSLSQDLGISFSTVSDWKKGKKMPRSGALQALAEHYNVNISYLTTDRDEIEEEYHNEDVWSYDFYDVGIAAGATESIARDYMEDEDVEQIEISDEVMGRYARNSDIAFTRVNGESMNRVIPHNSLIAIKRIENIWDFENDDIILFSYEDGFSIKRFYNDKENEQLIFSPESTSRGYHDIVVPYDLACELRIIGKVVLYIVHVE